MKQMCACTGRIELCGLPIPQNYPRYSVYLLSLLAVLVPEYKYWHLRRWAPGFMMVSGDISNSDGTGGKSIYGDTFPDEVHAQIVLLLLALPVQKYKYWHPRRYLRRYLPRWGPCATSTYFACFTSAKVQILTPEALFTAIPSQMRSTRNHKASCTSSLRPHTLVDWGLIH